MRCGLVLACILTFSPIVVGQVRGPWELQIGPAGDANPGLTSGALGFDADLGYFVIPNLEVSLRETVFYSSFANGTNWMSTTRAAADWQLDFGPVHPFIGGEGGYGIGIHNTSSIEIGPEAGVKVDLNDSLFLAVRFEYDHYFRHRPFATGIRDNAMILSGGIGVRW